MNQREWMESGEKDGEIEIKVEDATPKTTKTTTKKRSSSTKSQISPQEIDPKEETTSPQKQTTKKRQPRKKPPETTEKVPDETKKTGKDVVMEIVNESIESSSVNPIPTKKKRTVGQRKPKRDPVG